jgi:hypothetical protein
MKNRNEQIQDFINSLDGKTDIDIVYYCSTEDIESSNDIYEAIEENGGFDGEVIYYFNAIKYLSENDPSLNQSMSIAYEYGYKTKDINSELLASLLYSQDLREQYSNIESEIEDFFNSLED